MRAKEEKLISIEGYLSLNRINQRNKAIEEIKNYCFTKIYIFLDNDEGGESSKYF